MPFVLKEKDKGGGGVAFVTIETLIKVECESNVERLERWKKIVVSVAEEGGCCWEEKGGCSVCPLLTVRFKFFFYSRDLQPAMLIFFSIRCEMYNP